MKKIVLACDLDGTLIKHNDGANQPRSVLTKDKEAVKQFIDKGHLFIVSTGRNKNSTFALFEREKMLLPHSYYITSNGAKIYNEKLECIYEICLKKNIVEKVIELYLKCNKDNHLSLEIFDGEVGKVFSSKEEIETIPDLEHMVSICAFSSRNEIEDVTCFYKEAKALFKDANVLQNTWYVDVLPQNISKASAIEFVLNLVEGEKQLVAIGDSYNDVPMFEIANRSFTFNHSPEDVKEKSSDLVDHLYQAISLIL